MARTDLPEGQDRAFPLATILIVVALWVGLGICLAFDGRGDAWVGVVLVLLKLICWGYVLLGWAWALYLFWGRDRDVRAGVFTLVMITMSALILWILSITVGLF